MITARNGWLKREGCLPYTAVCGLQRGVAHGDQYWETEQDLTDDHRLLGEEQTQIAQRSGARQRHIECEAYNHRRD